MLQSCLVTNVPGGEHFHSGSPLHSHTKCCARFSVDTNRYMDPFLPPTSFSYPVLRNEVSKAESSSDSLCSSPLSSAVTHNLHVNHRILLCAYSRNLSEQHKANTEQEEPEHFISEQTSWVTTPSQSYWSSLHHFPTDSIRGSTATSECHTRTSSLPSSEPLSSPVHSSAEPDSVSDRLSPMLRTLGGIETPLCGSSSTELPASALLVRRLSRRRNRGAKSTVSCRTGSGVTTSPTATTSSSEQPTKEVPCKCTTTGDKHPPSSLSEVGSCEIAFTIRMHPDDPNAKFLRDLALDGLARCCEHHSVTSHSGVSHPISVDVRLRRPLHTHREHSKCSAQTSTEHDSMGSLTPETSSYEHHKLKCPEGCTQRDSESYCAHTIEDDKPPETEHSMDLSDSSLLDPNQLPYPPALPSPGNFKKLLRDRYLSSQPAFDRVFSAPITPSHECASNVGGDEDAMVSSYRNTTVAFTSPKLLRAQSECKLEGSGNASSKLTPLSSQKITPSFQLFPETATSSHRTPPSIASPNVLFSFSGGSTSSRSERTMDNSTPSASLPSDLSQESMETSFCFPDSIKAAEATKLLDSINQTFLRNHPGWPTQMYASTVADVETSSADDRTQGDPKRRMISAVSPLPIDTGCETPGSSAPKNLRLEEQSIFSFTSPSWTNITAAPFNLEVAGNDTVTKSQSAPISPEQLPPAPQPSQTPRCFRGAQAPLLSPEGVPLSPIQVYINTSNTTIQSSGELFMSGLKHLMAQQNSPLIASMPTFHKPSAACSDPRLDSISAVGNDSNVLASRNASTPSMQTTVAAASPRVTSSSFNHLTEIFRNSLLTRKQFHTTTSSSEAFVFPPPSPLRLSTTNSDDGQPGVNLATSWCDLKAIAEDAVVRRSEDNTNLGSSRENDEYFSRFVENLAQWAAINPGDSALSMLNTFTSPSTPISTESASRNLDGTMFVQDTGLNQVNETVHPREHDPAASASSDRVSNSPVSSTYGFPQQWLMTNPSNDSLNSSTSKKSNTDPTTVSLPTSNTSHRSTATRGRGSNNGGLHICSICGRQFTRSDMLVRHAHVHTGHRPFECTACGQAFSRSDHLSTHQRTHTGHRPYRCPLCTYSACRRDMITRHLRVHQRRGQLGNLEQFKHSKSGYNPQLNPIVNLTVPGTYDSNSFPQVSRGGRKPRRTTVLRSSTCSVEVTGPASLPSPPPLTFHTAPPTSSSDDPVVTS